MSTELNNTDRELYVSSYDINDSMKGQDFVLLYHNGTAWVAFATATSNSLDRSRDILDAASKALGGWAGGIGGRRSWSASVDAILYPEETGIGLEALEALFNKSSTIEIAFAPVTWMDKSGGNIVGKDYSTLGYYIGEANVSDLSLSADDNDIASFSCTFEGTGAIVYVPAEDPAPVALEATKKGSTAKK